MPGPAAAPPPAPDGGAAPAPPPLPGGSPPDAPGPQGGPPPLPGADPAPATAPEGPSLFEQAAFQVTEQTRTYPCRQCGGNLVFKIADQQLGCAACGHRSDIDVTHLPKPTERDLRAAMAELEALKGTVQPPQVSGEKEIVCQNCGGHSTFTGSLTATRCPYCATPIQRDDVHDAPARLPVDGVLPFQVDKKMAEGHLDEWINGRWFAPREFKKYAETGSFASVYTAYFTYDAFTRTFYEGQRGDNYTVTVGSGENRRTETRIRWRRVSGQVANNFDDVCVLANEGFDRKRIKALEPWPTQQAKPFAQAFVAGHLSRTYDHDAGECFGEARSEMEAAIESTVRRDIGGDHQRISRRDTSYDTLTYKHLLLPIWLLTVIFEQRPFQVFINGVTGEVQGQRPWSKVKIAVAVVVALIAIIVAVVLYQSLSGSSSS